MPDPSHVHGDERNGEPGTSVYPQSAERHTGPIRHCPECLRHSTVETVPGQSHTLNFKTITVPGYECCTHCGYVWGYIEETA